MTFDDWMLALHVLSAVAYGTGVILFWVLVVAVRTTDTADGTLRLAPTVMIGNIAIGIGAGGTIIFGIWLALSVRRLRPLGRLDHRGARAMGHRRGPRATSRARSTCAA